MALTICAVCDKNYLETLPQCRHCGKTTDEQLAYMRGEIAGRKAVIEEFKKSFAFAAENRQRRLTFPQRLCKAIKVLRGV